MVNTKTPSTKDAQRMCRSCLCKSTKLIPLDKSCNEIGKTKTDFVDSSETIGKIMMKCANIRIDDDDGLPQKVCLKCVADICAAFVYRQKCEQSDYELRKMFQQKITNASIKLEGDKNVAMGPTEESWFEEVESQVIFKTEEIHFEPEIEESTFQIDFESTSDHSYGGDMDGDDIGDDIYDQPQEKLQTRDAGAKKEYKCEICSPLRTFNRKYNWKQHQLVHTDEKNFACPICNNNYKSQNILKRHLRTHSESHGEKQRNQHKLTAPIERSSMRLPKQDLKNCKEEFSGPTFDCDLCGKVFNRKYNLKQHRLIHTGRKNFTCDICHDEFMKKSVLSRHLQKHVDAANKLATKTIEKNSTTERREKVSREKFCPFCSKVFTRTYNLNQHLLVHSGENRYSCDVCDRVYKSRRSARSCRHLKERRKKSTDEKYSCDVCQWEFSKKSNLKRHLLTHRDMVDIDEAVEQENGKTRHISKQQTENGEKKKKICQYCSKEFTRTYNLNQHLLVHTGEKKYSCDMCKQEYKSKRNLKAHILRHIELQERQKQIELNGGKPLKEKKIKMGPDNRYVCEVCAKPFKSLSNYHQHRLVHTNVRKFGCDICKRRYKTKNHLKNHMRTHYAGDSIYSHLCSVCGNRYQNLTRLVEHMRQHTGERPYECETCHKSFHKFYNLTMHKKIHALVKPHICTVCNRGFVVKDRLRVHMMLHTGERPYKCSFCSAGFVQGCLLRVHMRTHTGEMPYLCICGIRFQHRSQILKHRRQFNHFETKDENEMKASLQSQTDVKSESTPN